MLKKRRHWERRWRASAAFQIVDRKRAQARLSAAKRRMKALDNAS
jgi:hypothetical protein